MGLLALTTAATLLLGGLAQAHLARRNAATAADLAALAAAAGIGDQVATAPGGACDGPSEARAARAGELNGARLLRCATLADGSVIVEVAVDLPGAARRLGPAVASARAGQAPTDVYRDQPSPAVGPGAGGHDNGPPAAGEPRANGP